MEITKISPLPSILVEEPNHVDAEDAKASKEGASAQSSWLQNFWIYFCLIIAHWDIISYVPIDMYFRAAFAKTPPKATEPASTTVGQLALHPTLPLVAVCPSDYPEIILYNTGTSQKLRKLEVKLPKTVNSKGDVLNCTITCLKLSRWSKLAVGFSDGSVRVLEQNLPALLETDYIKDKRLSVRLIKLLPESSPGTSAQFVGSVTNLAFSMIQGITTGDDAWLAIATQNSGVWIWNDKSGQAIRVVNTAGINEGCLHWISLSSDKPKKRPITPTPATPEPKRLSESSIRKLGSIFGDANDISSIDEYFASSPGNTTPSIYFRTTTPASSPNRSDTLGSGPSAEPPQGPVHDKGSLLVIGTKDGKIRLQKLFHSSSMMRLITSVEFSPVAFVQPRAIFTSISGPAGGEITHLVINSPQLTEIEATVSIFVAFKGDKSSILREFSVSIPRNKFYKPWLIQAEDTARTIHHCLVNLVLGLTTIHYRMLFRQTPDPKLGRITYRAAHFIVTSPGSRNPQTAFLTSAAILPGTDLILTTLRLEKPQTFENSRKSECIVFSHNSLAATLNVVATVNPVFPAPSSLALDRHLQPSPPRGHFARQLYDVGIFGPRPPPQERSENDGRVGMVCVHDFICGQVAWGKNRSGKDVGAFTYRPASMLDRGVGIGMFEALE